MHAPVLTHVLTAGLVASAAVPGFQLNANAGLVVRNLAPLMLAGPVRALPAGRVDARHPHHQKAKAKGGSNNARDNEKAAHLDTRDPHHQKAKTNKGGSNNARDVEDGAQLETRDPHHQTTKAHGGKNNARNDE